MQAVGILGPCATLVQAAPPERRGAAPTSADVVHHVELVLHHVGVGPNLLMRIAGQLLGLVACKETGRVAYFVVARRPGGLVAVGATYLREEFLAAEHVLIVHITGGRHGQAPMPHHEVDVVLVAHFDGQRLRGQVVVDVVRHVVREPFRVFLGCGHLGDVAGKARLNVRVLRSILGVGACRVEVMEAAVAARGVGDVPEGIGTRRVLQGATAQGVGIAVGILRTVATLSGVGILPRPVAVGEDVWVQAIGQVAVLLLLGVLGFEVLVADGIEQARAIDADGGLQTHLVVAHVVAAVGHVDGTPGDVHFGVAQLVGLAVGELVAEGVGIFMPGDGDLRLVERRLEGGHGMSLRHACQPGHIGLGLGVVNHQQIAVSYLVGVERAAVLALAMPVARMTMDARRADVERSQAMAHAVEVGRERFLEELLATVEGGIHGSVGLDHGRGVFEGRRGRVGGSAQFAARVVPVGQLIGRHGRRVVALHVVVATGRQAQSGSKDYIKTGLFHH